MKDVLAFIGAGALLVLLLLAFAIPTENPLSQFTAPFRDRIRPLLAPRLPPEAERRSL